MMPRSKFSFAGPHRKLPPGHVIDKAQARLNALENEAIATGKEVPVRRADVLIASPGEDPREVVKRMKGNCILVDDTKN